MNLKLIKWILILLSLISLSCNAGDNLKRLSTDEFKKLNLPFSQAVEVDGILYLSGELGVKPGTLNLVDGGVKAQTRQALTNIQTTLKNFGSDMQHVIKCTLFLADIKEWPLVNDVYVEFFAGHLPARSAVAGSGLGLGARVEIECMAKVVTQS
ncbi:RidA family protein [Neptunicella marina]|uniref:RidA family protein n=1 Tax=Neptunicella marina TaxID=2125989 RepID=A0A8J6IXQ8_9ALTE|nr:Rid family detoxifying hydrolase [Neptunicella marina]MBC3767400.1 RidA family protein [Neptunicella marina]